MPVLSLRVLLRAGLGCVHCNTQVCEICSECEGQTWRVSAVGRVFGFLGDSVLPSALAAPASLRPHRPRPLDPGDLLSWWGRGQGGGLWENGVGAFAWGTECWGLGGLRWGRGWGLG